MLNSNPAYDSTTAARPTSIVHPFVVALFRHTPLYFFAAGLKGALRSGNR